MNKLFLTLGGILLFLTVSGCSSESKGTTYEGEPLHIAVYGERPIGVWDRVHFEDVDRDTLFDRGYKSDYSALLVMRDKLEEADTPAFAKIFQGLPYPVFFMDSYAEAYVYFHEHAGLGQIEDPGFIPIFATGLYQGKHKRTETSIVYQNPLEGEPDKDSLFVNLWYTVDEWLKEGEVLEEQELLHKAWETLRQQGWRDTAKGNLRQGKITQSTAGDDIEWFNESYKGERVHVVQFEDIQNVVTGTPKIVLDGKEKEVVGFIPTE